MSCNDIYTVREKMLLYCSLALIGNIFQLVLAVARARDLVFFSTPTGR